MIEREVKLHFPDADVARRAVMAAGAAPLRARRLQDDTLFDTADGSLRRQGCALRIRNDSGRHLVTFKGPLQAGTMKTREEQETVVGDGTVLMQVLAATGFHVVFRYQKYREEFSAGEVTVAIDETPIGTFVEIEGGEHGILDMTHALGRAPADFILESYRALFVVHREQFGLTSTEMVFAGE